MKRLFSPVLAVGIMLAAAHLALACTSFAVYGVRGPIFGMNWDLPSSDEAEQSAYGFFDRRPNRVAIYSTNGIKVFQYDHNFFFTDRGVFGCIQAAYPPQRMESGTKRIVNWYDLFHWGVKLERAPEIAEFLADHRLRHSLDTDVHCLFADSQGGAVIVETGVDDNVLLPREGSYIVMANFFLHVLEGELAEEFAQKYPEWDLLEALDFDGRYRRAQAMIEAALDDFDHTRAFEVLEAVTQRITKFSVVMVPEERKLFFALLGDFSRIWEVDLEAETIATYKGFAEQRVERLDIQGITVSRLLGWR